MVQDTQDVEVMVIHPHSVVIAVLLEDTVPTVVSNMLVVLVVMVLVVT